MLSHVFHHFKEKGTTKIYNGRFAAIISANYLK